jgi:hypothetical protein
LTVYFAGKKRYLTGKIIADDIFRRDSLVAQALQLFDLRGAQSRCISRNFIDSRFPLMSPAGGGSRGGFFN